MSALGWNRDLAVDTHVLRAATSADAEGVAALMAEPDVKQWWHQAWEAPRWAECLSSLTKDPGSLPLVLARETGEVAGYVEVYRVADDVLGGHIQHAPTDLGMHVALGESSRGQGLGVATIRAVLGAAAGILDGCRRLVAEPDERNARSVSAFAAAGFENRGAVRLPDKNATLLEAHVDTVTSVPSQPAIGGQTAGTSQPSAALLAKLVGALLSEELITAEAVGQAVNGGQDLRIELDNASYFFQAGRTAFGSYVVDPGTVRRVSRGVLGDDESQPVDDPGRFIVDVAGRLGLTGTTVANYIAELSATLAADAHLAAGGVSAKELLRLPHAEMEGQLTGHPLLVANKGRLGFSASDCARYAPEACRPLRPVWLAVSRRLAEFRSVPAMSEQDLVDSELSPATQERFNAVLRDAGADPSGYVLLPAHPWQVDHVVRQLWSGSVLSGQIIVLGEAEDRYLPTQSIRTLVNIDNPDKLQVKLPLKILNTSVYRGIPRHCSLAAPMTTHWLRSVWDADPALHTRAVLLGEVASVTVRHPHLADYPGIPYQWDETLGCIWREPVDPALGDGETVWPLALVLHRDPLGDTAVQALTERSGLDLADWLKALVSVTLAPLLHLLHTYGVTVNPHGENLMVICDVRGVPSRLVIKDLVDDVCVSTEPVPERTWEPDGHVRVLPRKPWNVLRQYLVDALFLGVWGPLGEILDAGDMPVSSADLWAMNRAVILEYADAHPEQAERLQATGLLGPEFNRYPLNGYRLLLGYTDLDTRPPVPKAGTMPNPMYIQAEQPRGGHGS
jgi:siderophore synthetase component/RimJ/RimL family protein N-acetyltransferase